MENSELIYACLQEQRQPSRRATVTDSYVVALGGVIDATTVQQEVLVSIVALLCLDGGSLEYCTCYTGREDDAMVKFTGDDWKKATLNLPRK